MTNKRFMGTILNAETFEELFGREETLHLAQHFLTEVAGIPVRSLEIMPPKGCYAVESRKTERDIIRNSVMYSAALEDGERVKIELAVCIPDLFLKYMSIYMKDAIFHGLETSVFYVNILNFLMPEDDPDPKEAVSAYGIAGPSAAGKRDAQLREYIPNGKVFKAITFELPKINEQSPLIQQEWKSLFFDASVTAKAPDHLKEAGKLVQNRWSGEDRL